MSERKVQRSNTILNAVLEHLRSGKRVAFSPELPLSSEDEFDDFEFPELTVAERHHRRKPEKLAALTKYKSHPHHALVLMAELRLLEGPYLLQQNLRSHLPEFNKRPLTDTPIVLGLTSPYNESDEEEKPAKLISHLSLADLNAVSEKALGARTVSPSDVSPNDSSANLPAAVSASDIAGNEISPKTSVPDVSQKPQGQPLLKQDYLLKELLHLPKESQKTQRKSLLKEPLGRSKILQQIKNDLLSDVPPELQQQFEKTPLLEKLKLMLLLEPFQKLKKAYTLNIPGQTSSKTSPDGHIASVDVGSKLVIVMVGLPARGKSYITNKLTRYLNWLQHDCRVFNVGNTRRMDKDNTYGPATTPLPDPATPLPGRLPQMGPNGVNAQSGNSAGKPSQSGNSTTSGPPKSGSRSHLADFFNPANKASNELREKWAMLTLDNLLAWVIDGPGSVGILDATNSTKKRRLKVLKKVQERLQGELKVLYLESICSDPAILHTNIHLKLAGPDYRDMDPEVALHDFVGRLKNYEKAYEPIDESEEKIPGFQYVKMIDVGKKVVAYNILGFLALQTVYFLLNFNLCERQIWLTRHGESTDNLLGRIGGDAGLTERGQRFAKTLSRFLNYQRKEFRRAQLEAFSLRLELRFHELQKDGAGADDADSALGQIPTEPSFCVWTSMLLRATETGSYFNDLLYHVKAMRMLNELGGGKFDGMTYNEIQRQAPREFELRLKNKLTYRYPGVGGESYLDVLVRLRPVINEIERTTDHLLIVLHRVVLRVLLAYFLNLDKSTIVDLDVPLHTLYCLELKPYGTEYAMYEYDELADWFKKIEPEHQKTMKEVGVNYKERKYSVIPTAPPRQSSVKRDHQRLVSNFSIRKSLSNADNEQKQKSDQKHKSDASVNSSSLRKLADLNKMRKP